MNRIIVVCIISTVVAPTWNILPYILWLLSSKQAYSIVFFLPMIATIGVVHSIIECKLALFYFYNVLGMFVENRCFEEKWVLMYLHFAQDRPKVKIEKSKNVFSNVVANFKISTGRLS